MRRRYGAVVGTDRGGGGQGELEETYDTERQLLYVACTRARDQLLVSAAVLGSEFLDDLGPGQAPGAARGRRPRAQAARTADRPAPGAPQVALNAEVR